MTNYSKLCNLKSWENMKPSFETSQKSFVCEIDIDEFVDDIFLDIAYTYDISYEKVNSFFYEKNHEFFKLKNSLFSENLYYEKYSLEISALMKSLIVPEDFSIRKSKLDECVNLYNSLDLSEKIEFLVKASN